MFLLIPVTFDIEYFTRSWNYYLYFYLSHFVLLIILVMPKIKNLFIYLILRVQLTPYKGDEISRVYTADRPQEVDPEYI